LQPSSKHLCKHQAGGLCWRHRNASSDGSQKALEVHIFPESMRGTGEGHYPWDLQPNSTMTNASVDQTVASVDGQTMMVKYKDGEKKIIVSSDTPVVAYEPGDRSDLSLARRSLSLQRPNRPMGRYRRAHGASGATA
jgi:hypothetical protein